MDPKLKRKITLQKAVNAARAIMSAKKVDPSIMKERMAICDSCKYKRRDRFNHDYCGMCGCNISSDENRILNMAAYVENLPKWGCKHPLRRIGQGGWIR